MPMEEEFVHEPGPKFKKAFELFEKNPCGATADNMKFVAEEGDIPGSYLPKVVEHLKKDHGTGDENSLKFQLARVIQEQAMAQGLGKSVYDVIDAITPEKDAETQHYLTDAVGHHIDSLPEEDAPIEEYEKLEGKIADKLAEDLDPKVLRYMVLHLGTLKRMKEEL